MKTIILKTPPTFEKIKSFFSPSETEKIEFVFSDRKAWAMRKFTFRKGGNVVNTNYLHIWVQVGLSEDTCIHYKETLSGNFKPV